MADVPFSILEKYNQQLEESNKLNNQLKTENEFLSLKLENANLKYELEKNKIKDTSRLAEALGQKVKTLERELLKMQSIKDEHEKIISELNNAHDLYEQEKRSFETKLAEKDQLIDVMVNKHKAEMNTQMEAAKKAFDSAIAELKDKNAKDLDEVEKALSNTISEFKKFREIHDKEKQAFETKFAKKDQNIAKLKNEHKAEMDAQNESSKQALDSAKAELINKHKVEMDAQNEAAKQTFDCAMAELKEKHAKAFDEAKKDFDLVNADLKNKYESQFKKYEEANKALKDEVDEKDKIIAELENEKSNNENVEPEVQVIPENSNSEVFILPNQINNRKRNASIEIINPVPFKKNNQTNSSTPSTESNSVGEQEIVELSDDDEESSSDFEEFPDFIVSVNDNEELSEFERKIIEILADKSSYHRDSPYKNLNTFMNSGNAEEKAVLKYFSNAYEVISSAVRGTLKFLITMRSGRRHELFPSSHGYKDQLLKTIGKSLISYQCNNNLYGRSLPPDCFNIFIGPKLKKVSIFEKISNGSKILIKESKSIILVEVSAFKSLYMLDNLPISCTTLTINDYTPCIVKLVNLKSIKSLILSGKIGITRNIAIMLSTWPEYFPEQLKKIKFILDIREIIPLQEILKEVKEIEKAITQYVPKKLKGSINYFIRCYYPNCNEPENKIKARKLAEEMNFKIYNSKQSKFYHIFKINNDRLTLRINFILVDYQCK